MRKGKGKKKGVGKKIEGKEKRTESGRKKAENGE